MERTVVYTADRAGTLRLSDWEAIIADVEALEVQTYNVTPVVEVRPGGGVRKVQVKL